MIEQLAGHLKGYVCMPVEQSGQPVGRGGALAPAPSGILLGPKKTDDRGLLFTTVEHGGREVVCHEQNVLDDERLLPRLVSPRLRGYRHNIGE